MRTVFNISGLLLCLLAALPGRAQVSDSASRPAPEQLAILQDTSYIVVRDIVVTGNKRTRRSIILREIGIKPGDTLRLRNLQVILETNRKQLLNTSLFLNVLTNVKDWNGNEANIVFDVWERWYLLAFPVFKLADRNFNQWWVEQKKASAA
ncbi:POTRA domain-containing protein [Chitinophaga pollutisoli]|uniref:POTRA domain-containing protein n=1 Tax=Chitinophaga pollutisoli TaxID=3133966 RepID=A0ABZ2YYV7_9BACT